MRVNWKPCPIAQYPCTRLVFLRALAIWMTQNGDLEGRPDERAVSGNACVTRRAADDRAGAHLRRVRGFFRHQFRRQDCLYHWHRKVQRGGHRVLQLGEYWTVFVCVLIALHEARGTP